MSSLYKVVKAWRYLKHFGWKEFWVRVRDRLEPEDVPYDPWFRSHCPDEKELEKQRKKGVPNGPLISVVIPVYKTPPEFLRQLLDSLKAQTYEKWEVCLADASGDDDTVRNTLKDYAGEKRILYKRLENNGGISENTNAAVKMANGTYIGFMDHDDLLAPQALYRMAQAAADGADLIYSDEDKVTHDLKKHLQPHFKPDFNPDLLRSNNYITHFLVVKKSLIGEDEPLNPVYDGAQDYDFILRMTEKAQKIVHVPEVLYHWRTHEASTADNPMSKLYAYEAGKRAIEAQLEREGLNGEVTLLPDYGFYRVKYPVQGKPLVSIIVPNKDHVATLKSCLECLEKTAYENFEVLVVENNSTEKTTFDYYKEAEKEDERVRVLYYKGGFNYSAINNFAVREAKGDYYLFLNNDVRAAITPDWLGEMLGMCQRRDVGAVGARLYYPNDTIQHAGCVIGIGGIAGAMFVGMARSRSGYMHKAAIIQDLSAVTAACMLVKKEAFEKAGGFEEKLTVAFNDIDLCLKIGQAGYRIIYDPYAELYHDESLSRGSEDSPEKVKRFQSEIEYMRTRWIDILKNGDPNYNKNLSLKKWNYSLRV